MAATARSRCSRASLLDSTILIDFLRGRPGAIDGWKAGTWRREFAGRDLHSARQYPAIVDALRAADAERWAHGGQRDARTVASTHAEAP